MTRLVDGHCKSDKQTNNMSEDTPQLVHIEVDGPPEHVDEWTQAVRRNPLPGYEFIVSDADGTVRSVLDRDELVADIATAVVDKLEDEQ